MDDLDCLCMVTAARVACGSLPQFPCGEGLQLHDAKQDRVLYEDSIRCLAGALVRMHPDHNDDGRWDVRHWDTAKECCVNWNDHQAFNLEEDVLPVLAAARDEALEMERKVSK